MKSCTPLWREAHLPVKKSHLTFGALSEVEMSKKCTPLWCEADFQVKMHKTHQRRTTFGSCDVEKVHGIVARSAFPSQNVPKKQRRTTFGSCYVEKSARRCCANFQVKMCKAHQHRTTFRSCDVEKEYAVVARSTYPSQKCKAKTEGYGALLDAQMSFCLAGARSSAPANVRVL